MTKNIFTIAIIAIIFVFSSCEKEELLQKSSIETTESDFFSVEYNYSDTIRLSNNGQGYVDIVVSSDKEDVLKTHLGKYEYFLATNDISNVKKEENQEINGDNNSYSTISKYDFNDMRKISIEIIGVGGINLNEFDIKCRQNKILLSSSIQRVSVNPTAWYYEYSSRVHDYYGKVKYTNVTSHGDFIPTTLVRYGYKKCMLCSVITWPNGQWRDLMHSYNGYMYDNNAFGYDGTHYIPGTNIYRLYTGVLSYSPDNFDIRFSSGPIGYW